MDTTEKILLPEETTSSLSNQTTDEKVKAFIDNLIKALETSKSYLNDKIVDSFASSIYSLFETPLASALKSYRTNEAKILEVLKDVTIDFLLNAKDLIEVLYVSETPEQTNELHFIIVLKKDNLESRASLNTFPIVYEQSGLDKRFPIAFHYVPKEFATKVNHISEISLDANTSQSS